MSIDLRRRLLVTLATGSVEELAVALQLLLMLSTTHNNRKTPDRIFTPDRAQGLHECKLYPDYLTAIFRRN